jgi:hypothetical protein
MSSITYLRELFPEAVDEGCWIIGAFVHSDHQVLNRCIWCMGVVTKGFELMAFFVTLEVVPTPSFPAMVLLLASPRAVTKLLEPALSFIDEGLFALLLVFWSSS